MTLEELGIYRTGIRPQLRAGDAIFWFGDSLLARAIRLFASGPSHACLIRQGAHQNSDGPSIIESTIHGSQNGIQTNNFDEAVKNYKGAIIWCPLSDESRRAFDLEAFYAACGALDGFTRYDTEGLVEFLGRDIPVLGTRIGQVAHTDKMVCSAAVIALWEKSKLLRGINYNLISPQAIVEMRLYARAVNIVGNQKLTRFNLN